MIQKRPLDSHRLRTKPPRGFGWLDHRLLREGYLARCAPPAWALYCLLVCAGDGQGLSFYGEPRLQELLQIDRPALRQARRALATLGLIAYREPLYQVLALPATPPRLAPALPAAPFPRQAAAPPPSQPCPPPAGPAPAGLDLRAMLQSALRAGGER
jgi:hypothetical protein